jgi:ferritin-like metal-binding protein YciE
MPTKLSNPRDLLLALLADLLHVERRLAGQVLAEVARDVQDGELRTLLDEHRHETRQHVERLESAFYALDATPSANLSRAFEGAVAQHDELAPGVVDRVLRDAFHAQAALHVEHYEVAGYRSVLAAAPQLRELLEPSLEEEERAAKRLEKTLERLARAR